MLSYLTAANRTNSTKTTGLKTRIISQSRSLGTADLHEVSIMLTVEQTTPNTVARRKDRASYSLQLEPFSTSKTYSFFRGDLRRCKRKRVKKRRQIPHST